MLVKAAEGQPLRWDLGRGAGRRTFTDRTSTWREYIDFTVKSMPPSAWRRRCNGLQGATAKAHPSVFCGELENVLNIQVQQGNSLGRETLAGLSGHFVAECRQDIPSYFELAPRERSAGRFKLGT